MAIEQYTYWSVTINNPDENDYLIIRNPNPKYIREVIWTPEVGAEDGTPHIQGWVRLQRNQSQAFVKKLYPRAHLQPCRKDDYNENCHRYAQKNDETTAGNHHITLNDPLPAVDTILYKVLEEAAERAIELNPEFQTMWVKYGPQMFMMKDFYLKKLDLSLIERRKVSETSGLEKVFVSPTYEKIKLAYWREILFRIYSHKQENALHESGNDVLQEEEGSPSGGQGSEGDQDSEASEDVGSTESGSVSSGSSDDFEESGE